MTVLARIGGMRTVHCVRAVFQALAGVPGVEHAEVILGEATLDTTAAFDPVALGSALSALGYALISLQAGRRPLPVA